MEDPEESVGTQGSLRQEGEWPQIYLYLEPPWSGNIVLITALHLLSPLLRIPFPMLFWGWALFIVLGQLIRKVFHDHPAKAASLSPHHSDLLRGPITLWNDLRTLRYVTSHPN